MSEVKQKYRERCESKNGGQRCIYHYSHLGPHGNEDRNRQWFDLAPTPAEPVIEVAPGEPTCEYCGPECYGGAAHNIRVEDGARYTDDPVPAVPELRLPDSFGSMGPSQAVKDWGERFEALAHTAVPAQEAPRGCNLAEIPGHDCAVDACEPAEPQAGAQDERWQRIYNSCNPGSATRELIDELRALKAALSKARETLIDHQLHADGRIVKALDIVRSALFATPLGAQVPRVGIIDTPENRIRYRDRIAAQVPSLVKLGLDYRAVVAKHPGGFPEGRLAEIDAALGAQVPSRCTTYDDVTTEEANNGEERARQIIKTMDAFDPLDALSTLYAIQFHLESRLAHIVSYATEAAKTPITRESILAAPQVDEAPIPENLKMDYGMYKKSGLGGPAELIERIAQLEAENRARKLTQLTQSDEMQGFCRLVLSEIGGGL